MKAGGDQILCKYIAQRLSTDIITAPETSSRGTIRYTDANCHPPRRIRICKGDYVVTTISQRIASAYDRIAMDFAATNAAMPAELGMRLDRFLARLGPNARVLDVGCGAGRDMAWMEERGAHVTGVDISAGMLAQARTIVRGPLLQMDMCHLDFSSGSFDGVWCCASLLHLPKAQAPVALNEMRRILAERGVLYVGVQEGEGEAWESTTPYGAVERFFARYSQDEFVLLLSRNGFMIDELVCNEAPARTRLNVFATALPDANAEKGASGAID